MKSGNPLTRIIHSRVVRWFAIVIVSLSGGYAAIAIAGDVHEEVGPLETTFSVRPSTDGDTRLELAPLGSMTMPTHRGPASLHISVDRLELPETRALIDEGASSEELQATLESDTRRAVILLVIKSMVVSTVGGALAAAAVTRRVKPTVVGAIVPVLVLSASLAAAATTFRSAALSEPKFSGVLALAPRAIGDVRDVATKFGAYRAQLDSLVGNLTGLYRAADSTATGAPGNDTIRVLHVSDMHLNPAGFDLAQRMVEQFRVSAVLDTGDINDWGTSFEGGYADRIARLRVPYVYVRGNHDSLQTQASVASQPNARVLDGNTTDIEGLRIWGIGDPRFTPDKEGGSASVDAQRVQAEQFAAFTRERLRTSIPPAVDVAMVHDPVTARESGGLSPLFLAGHYHRPEERQVGPSRVLIEGSTGAAGLRGADNGTPIPLHCSVLYFDRATKQLVAYDEVSVSGLGGSGASIERHITPPQLPPVAPPPPLGATAP